METYVGDAFSGYDEDDVEGVLDDFAQKSKERFLEVLDSLDVFCGRVPMPKAKSSSPNNSAARESMAARRWTSTHSCAEGSTAL